ncbi:unnamed protein product [Moneuplotes crassus]|uniref:Cullin family profile domain-containing protein n=1 Tax=Euplotes crassus TaxID=5936 RepID=A0AAD1Y6N8_EUPCR|nr:unnamed protein product [Moneuplotes crassus]
MTDEEMEIDQVVDQIIEFIGLVDGSVEASEICKKNDTFVKLYTAVYKLADHPEYPSYLYEFYIKTICNYCKEIRVKIYNTEGDKLVEEYTKEFEKYNVQARWLSRILSPINRHYLSFNQIESTVVFANKAFKSIVYGEIKKKLAEALINQIVTLRHADDISWNLNHRVIESLLISGCEGEIKIEKVGENFKWVGQINNFQDYDELFENRFLENSKEYYLTICNEWLQSLNNIEFIISATDKIELEEQMADNYIKDNQIHPKTKPKLSKILNEVFIGKSAETLIQQEQERLREMLRSKKFDQYSKMCSFFSRLDSTFELILFEMKAYISKCLGQEIIENEDLHKDSALFTQAIIDLKKETDLIIEKGFKNSQKAIRARNQCFIDLLAKLPCASQCFAKQCDYLLKEGIKEMEDQDIEQSLDEIVNLFGYLQNKDLFIKIYTLHLSSRVLNRRMLRTDLEKLMIAKLKAESGINTFIKLSKIVSDIDLSKDFMDEFRKINKGSTEIDGIPTNIDVLTSGIIQQGDPYSCTIPAELSNCCKMFETFYKQKHSGKHLKWLHNFSSVEMETLTLLKTYTLKISCYQAAILCLFNGHNRLTVAQIKEITGLPGDELSRQLKKLCNPKIELISKENLKTSKFTDDEVLEFNTKFSNMLLKISLAPKTQSLGQNQQNAEIENHIEQEIMRDRTLILDSIIVRIMKARKICNHGQLITVVLDQPLLFKPQPQMIKQSIERLIEREYLRRDPNDRRNLIYIP